MVTNVQFVPQIDVNQSLWDLGAALTADSTGLTPGGGVDLGDGVQESFAILLSIAAIDIASGDETYTLRLMGSNDLFSTKVCLSSFELGRAALLGTNKTTGTFRWLASNYMGTGGGVDTAYRYIRLELDVGGTSPSIQGAAYRYPLQGMA